jgi:hypothetical protein
VKKLTLIALLLNAICFAQLGPPSLRCLEILPNGNVKLTWLPITDPNGIFDSYEIYTSPSALGPYTVAGNVGAVAFNTFTHTTTGGNTQSIYYFIRTRSGAGGNTFSFPSDTMRTIYLSALQASPDVKLTYNQLHQPRYSFTNSNFNVLKEYPAAIWGILGTTTLTQYADTLSICSASINYQITQADNSGCISYSNIKGDIFSDKKAPNEPSIDSISVLPNGQTAIGWTIPRDIDIHKYFIYYNLSGYALIDSLVGRNNSIYTYTAFTATTTTVGLEIAALDSCRNLGSFDIKPTTMYLTKKYDSCAYSTQLNWNSYVGMKGGISEYRIYYSVNGSAFVPVGTSSITTFTHNGVSPAQNISYFVRVFNKGHSISSSSNRVNFFSYQVPAPLFVYVSNASVIDKTSIEIKLVIDLSVPSQGVDLLRSSDGVNFASIAYMPFTGGSFFSFVDKEVDPNSTSYYYKAIVTDACGNPRVNSNVAKTVLLKIRSDKENDFKKNLIWTDYKGYDGGTSGYNIYRVVNEVMPSSPTAQRGFGDTTFVDDVEDEASNGSKVEYFVEAVEGGGIPDQYGLSEIAKSNKVEVYQEARVFVPGAFAPQGINKIWLPVTHFVDKNEYQVRVFDKWGEIVFSTNSDLEGWDGKNAKPDVYVYLISFKNSRGEYIEVKGTFVML